MTPENTRKLDKQPNFNKPLEHSPEVLGFPIDPNGIFIDVGANIGLYSIALSGIFQRTLAFEANHVTYAHHGRRGRTIGDRPF